MQPAFAQARILNVKNAPYNAKGDGVSDDSVPLQQAIDAAATNPGSIVFLPRGTYFHSVAIGKNAVGIKLRGAGPAATKLTGEGINFNGSDLEISGLTNDSGSEFFSIRRVQISNCHFNRSINFFRATDCVIKNCIGKNGAVQLTQCDRTAFENISWEKSASATGCFFIAQSGDFSIKSSKLVINQKRAIDIVDVGPVLIEGCNMLGVSNFDGCVRTSNSRDVTIRNNLMTASPGVVGRYGVETSRDNVLVSNNKISKLVTPIKTLESQIRIVGNGITDADFHGIVIDSHQTAYVAGNNIARCAEAGILAVSTSPIGSTNELKIENNILRDCGLTGFEAVILVDSVTNFPVTIQRNIYTGNRNGLTCFIRCVIPSPPAVVRGNITNTMLPIVVGQ